MMHGLSKTLIVSLSVIGGFSAYAQVAPQMPTQASQSAPAQMGSLPAFTNPAQVSQDLARIDRALNSTVSFSGRFAQYASDGSFSQGRIYLKRPGKVRFEYDPPTSLLMVSDGVTLTQIDKKLGTQDRVPLSATPLAFFLANNVNLENDVEVTSLQKTAQSTSVTARDGSGEMDGSITMVFNPQTLALNEWVILDGFGQQTRVILSDIQYNQKLNPRLFVLRDETRRDRRR